MRLLFCIKTMNNRGGGAERVLAEVTGGLIDRGYDISILSFDRPCGYSFYPLHSMINRIELGIGSISGPATVFSTIRRIVALRKNILKYKPDIVIGFMHSMFIPLGISMIGMSIPLIASEHIVPEHYRSRPLERLLLWLVPLMARRITCVSEQARCAYPPFVRKKMVAVSNPVHLDISGKADVTGEKAGRKILLSVGRLDPQKDHEILIDAFVKIARQLPDWDLRILGDGELRSKLELKVARLGMNDRIFLPGSTEKISDEYLSAQLYVQPSRYESFGLTIAEALSYGLPAIGFDDCKGTNELIRSGVNGDLADGRADRSTNLASTLRKHMKEDKLRVRLSQKTHDGLDRFGLTNVLDQWESLFLKIVPERKPPPWRNCQSSEFTSNTVWPA